MPDSRRFPGKHEPGRSNQSSFSRPPQRSAGAVLFTRRGSECVLVRSRTGEWGLPKGHLEVGETEAQAAVREVLEEAGARARLLPGFREEIAYSLPGGERKVVTFFAAASEEDAFAPHEGDVTQSGAFTLDKALALIPHEDVRRVLRHAFAQYTHNEVAHG